MFDAFGSRDGQCHALELVMPLPIWIVLVVSLGSTTVTQSREQTPNAFFARGAPTFVVGTLGDERCDRAVKGQVELMRDLVFHAAPVVDDVSVGAEWPTNPILYGGAHVNAVVKALGADLPFVVDVGLVEIGGERFVGDEYRLIAFVPASEEHPDFLLYAGAATPGVEEINAVDHGDEGFVVCDRFGALVRGTWEHDGAGKWLAKCGKRARRIEWRESSPDPTRVRIRRAVMVEATQDDAAQDAAIVRGLSRAEARLGFGLDAALAVYVYPDRGSKRSLCAKSADGHADPMSRTLHVIACDSGADGPLENLVAHEATHVLAAARLGPAGSPLLGEGLAVWVSGRYAGKTLDAWRAELARPAPSIEELLGPSFRRLPEATSYPLGGLFVEALVDSVGREKTLHELYGAGASSWTKACERAGTSAARVSQAFEAALAR